jgi:Amt family ammonium transporter
MSALLEEPKLTYSQKFSRLGKRLRDPEWQRFGRNLLIGKFLGLAVLPVVLLVIQGVLNWFTIHSAYADTGAAASPVMPADLVDMAKNPVINPINTGWVLLGAFLVFGMQAGFTMLEAGFCRSRETVNVLVECVFDTCVCGLLHWAWGFAFMFGGGNAFIGWHMPGDPSKSLIFMKDVDVLSVYGATGIPIFAHYLFQFAFADCASTISSCRRCGVPAAGTRSSTFAST